MDQYGPLWHFDLNPKKVQVASKSPRNKKANRTQSNDIDLYKRATNKICNKYSVGGMPTSPISPSSSPMSDSKRRVKEL